MKCGSAEAEITSISLLVAHFLYFTGGLSSFLSSTQVSVISNSPLWHRLALRSKYFPLFLYLPDIEQGEVLFMLSRKTFQRFTAPAVASLARKISYGTERKIIYSNGCRHTLLKIRER